MLFMETSALESLNVENSFVKLLTEIYNRLFKKDHHVPKAMPKEKSSNNVQDKSFLDYLESDLRGIKYTKNKLIKDPSKEPEETKDEKGLIGSNEQSLGKFGSNVEIKRDGHTLVIKILDNDEAGNVVVREDTQTVLSREKELIDEKSKLGKSYEDLKVVHSKTLDELAALKEDRKLLISTVIPHIVGTLRRSPEFYSALSKIQGFAIRLGRQQCLEAFREANLKDGLGELENNSDPSALDKFKVAIKNFEEIQFPYVNKVSNNINCSAKDILKIKPSQSLS